VHGSFSAASLRSVDPYLEDLVCSAEQYLDSDPRASLVKLRECAECLQHKLALHYGVPLKAPDTGYERPFAKVREDLRTVVGEEITEHFFRIYNDGSKGAHYPPIPADKARKLAVECIGRVHTVAQWYAASFRSSSPFRISLFRPIAGLAGFLALAFCGFLVSPKNPPSPWQNYAVQNNVPPAFSPPPTVLSQQGTPGPPNVPAASTPSGPPSVTKAPNPPLNPPLSLDPNDYNGGNSAVVPDRSAKLSPPPQPPRPTFKLLRVLHLWIVPYIPQHVIFDDADRLVVHNKRGIAVLIDGQQASNCIDDDLTFTQHGMYTFQSCGETRSNVDVEKYIYQ
jgi:hypothetical protein